MSIFAQLTPMQPGPSVPRAAKTTASRSYRKLVAWAIDEADSGWLYFECLSAVGDIAEQSPYFCRSDNLGSASLACWVEQRLLPLRNAGEELPAFRCHCSLE